MQVKVSLFMFLRVSSNEEKPMWAYIPANNAFKSFSFEKLLKLKPLILHFKLTPDPKDWLIIGMLLLVSMYIY